MTDNCDTCRSVAQQQATPLTTWYEFLYIITQFINIFILRINHQITLSYNGNNLHNL